MQFLNKTLSFFWVLLVIFNGFQIPLTLCRLFTSSNVNVERLANVVSNADLDVFLIDYIIGKDPVVDQLNSYLGEYNKIRRDIIKSDANEFLTNPINEFLLVRRLVEWKKINELLVSMDSRNASIFSNSTDKGKNKEDFLLNVLSSKNLMPTDEDDMGAALGLLRLQMTYRLDTIDVADGKIVSSGLKINSNPLIAQDCLLLGEQSYMIGKYDYAVSWLKESLQRYYKEGYKTASLEEILKYYVFVSYKQGNFKLASNLTQQLLQLMPPGSKGELKNVFDAYESRRAKTEVSTGQPDHSEDYYALCRGEKLMEKETEAQLHCSYTSGNSGSAFLRIQRVKQEIVSLNPYIVIYHDIISDKDIEIVKEIANPKMGRVLTINALTEEGFASQRRVGETTVLIDENYSVLQRISRHLEDITGYVGSDWSNILSYGVGGYFSPHCDYIRNKTLESKTGNHLATLIIYLNEAEIGGATVFPIAKTRVYPIKGSAAFWYNLNPNNGEGNPSTLHASCPVLSGSKWVLVKSINSLEQNTGGGANFF